MFAVTTVAASFAPGSSAVEHRRRGTHFLLVVHSNQVIQSSPLLASLAMAAQDYYLDEIGILGLNQSSASSTTRISFFLNGYQFSR